MKINQLAKNLMCAGAISVLTVFPSFANEETDTTGNLTVGNINIEFSTQEDLKEIVFPGELIEKKLTINNNGNKTWIRLKFTLDNENVEIPNNIRIEDENWIKIGDYYYLSEAFDKEDSVSVEYLLNVPKNLTNQDSLKQFRVISHVEAIQESNFIPDFSAEDPWYGADIVESETSETPETGTITNEFTVTYIGGAEGFINSETSFFDLFTDLMPGDEIIKELTIENIDDKKIYFTLNPVFTADDELMNNVFIYFYLDGEEIGGGSLAEISGKEISLLRLNTDESTKLTCKVSMSPDIDNKYALAKIDGDWTFTAKYRSSGNNGHTSGNGGGSGSGSSHVVTYHFYNDNGPGMNLDTDKDVTVVDQEKPDTPNTPIEETDGSSNTNVSQGSAINQESDHVKNNDKDVNKGLVKTGDNMLDQKLMIATIVTGLFAAILYVAEKLTRKKRTKES